MLDSTKSRVNSKLPPLFLVLLALLCFAAFWSDSKLVPGIRNNIGLFEAIGAILFVAWAVYAYRTDIPVRGDTLITLIGIWFFLAMVSLFNLLNRPAELFQISFIQAMIWLFQFALSLCLLNILLLDKGHLLFVFRCLAISIALVGIWVLFDQIKSPGDYNATGPFRGRSQMGIYMAGAFWLVLLYSAMPGLKEWERWISLPILAVTLYAVAVSLRQSVYVSFFIGLAIFVVSFFFLSGGGRLRMLVMVSSLLLFGAFLLFSGGQYLGQLQVFQREFTGVPERLASAARTSDPTDSETFDEGQRRGAIKAFIENPLLGIGWQGFYRSDYSPTGNELHSTPWRILAELGLAGIFVYVAFIGNLFSRAFNLFRRARRTSYQLSALVLYIMLFSYFVSHYYNRMFTDRPYYLVLVIVMILEWQIVSEVHSTSQTEARPLLFAPADP